MREGHGRPQHDGKPPHWCVGRVLPFHHVTFHLTGSRQSDDPSLLAAMKLLYIPIVMEIVFI